MLHAYAQAELILDATLLGIVVFLFVLLLGLFGLARHVANKCCVFVIFQFVCQSDTVPIELESGLDGSQLTLTFSTEPGRLVPACFDQQLIALVGRPQLAPEGALRLGLPSCIA